MSKLSDAESEAAETQVWLEFAVKCQYLSREEARALYQAYDDVIRTLVGMIIHPETWVIGSQNKEIREEPEDYNFLF